MYLAMLHYRYIALKISSVYYSRSYERNVTDGQYGEGWACRCSTLPINIQHV